MREALDLAHAALGQTSPNPTVGCVIVKDGGIIGRGAHYYAAKDHAEIVALRQAGEGARGADVYLTLEPCSHQGRTGPCADALIAAGAARVFAAMEDPNPRVAGSGFAKLKAAGIEVIPVPAAHEEAARLNEPFIHFMRTGRPLVTLKSAVTLDGKIAAPENNDGWITSDLARLHVQSLRHTTDVMVTGIGTVLADDPLLNDRTGLPRSRPLLRVVLDSTLRLSIHSRLVTSANQDVLLASTTAANPAQKAALEERGVEVAILEASAGRVSLEMLIQELARRQYLSVMIEAGSMVNWAALDSGIVDKIFFYYAPKILGGLQSLPVAGGIGRRSRADAIQLRGMRVHPITPEEFAVEAWVEK